MGKNALIRLYSQKNAYCKPSFYGALEVSLDGHPQGIGLTLLKLLSKAKYANRESAGVTDKKYQSILNGKELRLWDYWDEKSSWYMKGVGCFFAQLVAYLKTCPGEVYMIPIDDDHTNMYPTTHTDYCYDIILSDSEQPYGPCFVKSVSISKNENYLHTLLKEGSVEECMVWLKRDWSKHSNEENIREMQQIT